MTPFHVQLLQTYSALLDGRHSFSASTLAAMAVMATDPARRFTPRELAPALNVGEMAVRNILARLEREGMATNGMLTEDGKSAMGLQPFRFAAPTVHIPLPRAEVIRRSVERTIRRQACPLPPPAPTTGPPPALADDEDVPM